MTFTKISRLIQDKQKTGFAKSPAQAALICEQARISIQALLKKDIQDLRYQFKKGILYIFAPHALAPELNMRLSEIQKILDQRIGEGKIKTIKIRVE